MTDSKLIDANVIISSDAPVGDELMFCHSILTQIG